MLPNVLQYPVALFGALRAGLVVVNVDPFRASGELEHQLRDSGAKAILILANFARALAEVVDKTEIEHVIVTEIGDLLPYWKAKVVSLVVKHIKKMAPDHTLPGEIALNDALAAGSERQLRPVAIAGEDLACIQYTGGTTGPSKGAMLTHRNMVANIQQLPRLSRAVAPRGRGNRHHRPAAAPRFLPDRELPVFCPARRAERADHQPAISRCSCRKCASGSSRSSPAPAPSSTRWWNQPKFAQQDFGTQAGDRRRLRGPADGGRTLAGRDRRADPWRARLDRSRADGLHQSRRSRRVRRRRRPPLPSTEIGLRDAAGDEAPPGEPGELCVRGPQGCAVTGGSRRRPPAPFATAGC